MKLNLKKIIAYTKRKWNSKKSKHRMKQVLTTMFYSIKENVVYDPFSLMQKVRWQRYMHLRIRLLKTTSHQDIAREFHKCYIDVLNEFGINIVDSIKGEWWHNPLDYMIVIEDVYTGELAGGIRITVVDREHPIPIEKLLIQQSPEIVERVHKWDNILGEVCSLWLKKKFSERGLAQILNLCVLSVAEKLRVKVLCATPPPHTRPIFEMLGYSRIRIGNNAEYLSSDGITMAVALEIDAVNLSDTAENIKEKIISLREQPVQKIKEFCNGYVTKIDYKLRL